MILVVNLASSAILPLGVGTGLACIKQGLVGLKPTLDQGTTPNLCHLGGEDALCKTPP